MGLVQKVRNFDASKISTFTVCPMIITVNVEIFDGCLISFFSSIFFGFFRPWTQRTKLNIYVGVRVRGSHTYVNITDENLCARNLRIVGLVQKVRNFDASKISTFTVWDENLCARNLRIVGLVQKVRNFDASKISTFTVCPMIITVNVEIFDGV